MTKDPRSRKERAKAWAEQRKERIEREHRNPPTIEELLDEVQGEEPDYPPPDAPRDVPEAGLMFWANLYAIRCRLAFTGLILGIFPGLAGVVLLFVALGEQDLSFAAAATVCLVIAAPLCVPWVLARRHWKRTMREGIPAVGVLLESGEYVFTDGEHLHSQTRWYYGYRHEGQTYMGHFNDPHDDPHIRTGQITWVLVDPEKPTRSLPYPPRY